MPSTERCKIHRTRIQPKQYRIASLLTTTPNYTKLENNTRTSRALETSSTHKHKLSHTRRRLPTRARACQGSVIIRQSRPGRHLLILPCSQRKRPLTRQRRQSAGAADRPRRARDHQKSPCPSVTSARPGHGPQLPPSSPQRSVQ